MTTELQCYRKGCGKKYLTDQNKEDSCQYHPGGPIFHDAMKGWSCCNKRSTDFTQFLNTPGCTYGYHSNEKPAPEVKPEPAPLLEENIIRGPPPKPVAPEKRPAVDEPMVVLSKTVTPSLEQSLAKQKESLQNQQNIIDGDGVPIGHPCSNHSCKGRYSGPASNDETCCYHPGSAIFHEGMKFWSCCQRKTSEFDKFLSQEGCEEGRHRWELKKKAECRRDWHQAGSKVIISIFAKCADPIKTVIKANRVSIDIYVTFADDMVYSEQLVLYGVINVKKSSVKLMGTKVEISLHKEELSTWSCLEYENPVKESN